MGNPGLSMALMPTQHWDQEASTAESTTTGGKCVTKWGEHLEYCRTTAHSVSSNSQKWMSANETLQYQAYLAVADHVYKAIARNEVTMLY